MLVHTCCCIFIFLMLGFDQILKEFEFKLKLGLKMCLRKQKRKIVFIPFLPLGRAQQPRVRVVLLSAAQQCAVLSPLGLADRWAPHVSVIFNNLESYPCRTPSPSPRPPLPRLRAAHASSYCLASQAIGSLKQHSPSSAACHHRLVTSRTSQPRREERAAATLPHAREGHRACEQRIESKPSCMRGRPPSCRRFAHARTSQRLSATKPAEEVHNPSCTSISYIPLIYLFLCLIVFLPIVNQLHSISCSCKSIALSLLLASYIVQHANEHPDEQLKVSRSMH